MVGILTTWCFAEGTPTTGNIDNTPVKQTTVSKNKKKVKPRKIHHKAQPQNKKFQDKQTK